MGRLFSWVAQNHLRGDAIRAELPRLVDAQPQIPLVAIRWRGNAASV